MCVLREDGSRVAGRTRSREPPTLPAGRWSLTLPLPHTRADLCWTGGSIAHAAQAREHGGQAAEQSQ
jgi:hypothetical protein